MKIIKIYYLLEMLVCGKTFMSNCIAGELLKKGKTKKENGINNQNNDSNNNHRKL